MTILVTGTTGLVGVRLLPRLVEVGIRSGKASPAGTMVEGDILDPASLVDAVVVVLAIVHLAAVFSAPDSDLIWHSNYARDPKRSLPPVHACCQP